jgi:hypothetical protein
VAVAKDTWQEGDRKVAGPIYHNGVETLSWSCQVHTFEQEWVDGHICPLDICLHSQKLGKGLISL